MSKLLPPNSTPLEKALAAQADRITAIPIGIAALHRIDTCPAAYLPWLAWSLRVEFWDSNWSVAQKRQVMADSKAVNQAKGTSYALTYALNQVTSSYQLIAWHQLMPQGTPFTFTVQLPEAQLYSIDEIQTIHAAIDTAKSARDVYSVQARVRTTSTALVAGAAREGQHAHLSTLD